MVKIVIMRCLYLKLTGSIDYSESLIASKDYANKVNLTDMMFRKPTKSVVFDELSKRNAGIEGIPYLQMLEDLLHNLIMMIQI